MTTAIIIALVVLALAGLAGGYAWGWTNGRSSAQHAPDGPETCRARLRAEQREKEIWKGRAQQLEQKIGELEHSMTVTGEWLLSELDQASNAAVSSGRGL